jgi:hypothetical protein
MFTPNPTRITPSESCVSGIVYPMVPNGTAGQKATTSRLVTADGKLIGKLSRLLHKKNHRKVQDRQESVKKA